MGKTKEKKKIKNPKGQKKSKKELKQAGKSKIGT